MANRPYQELLARLRDAFPAPVSDRKHDAYFVFSILRALDQVDDLKSEVPLLPAIYNPNLVSDDTSYGHMETEAAVVAMVSRLVGYDPARAAGVFTFGGTGTVFNDYDFEANPLGFRPRTVRALA